MSGAKATFCASSSFFSASCSSSSPYLSPFLETSCVCIPIKLLSAPIIGSSDGRLRSNTS